MTLSMVPLETAVTCDTLFKAKGSSVRASQYDAPHLGGRWAFGSFQ